jgi:hypothetical protein
VKVTENFVNSTTRIGGAIVLGILIIFGALRVSTRASATAGEVVVLPAPEREYIQTQDSNGDGVKDWEEHLGVTVTQGSTTATTTDAGSYTPPTTLTGKFSEAFLKDYLEGKVNKKDISNPKALVGSALQAIDTNTQSRVHTVSELTTINTTPESLHTYGNHVAGIIQKYSIKNEYELDILQRAIATQDQSILTELDPIIEMYKNLITESTVIEVPQTMTQEHIALINSYETLYTDLTAMRVAFNDPLLALARISHYKADAQTLHTSLGNVSKSIKKQDVTFTGKDSGFLLYFFEINTI